MLYDPDESPAELDPDFGTAHLGDRFGDRTGVFETRDEDFYALWAPPGGRYDRGVEDWLPDQTVPDDEQDQRDRPEYSSR